MVLELEQQLKRPESSLSLSLCISPEQGGGAWEAFGRRDSGLVWSQQ